MRPKALFFFLKEGKRGRRIGGLLRQISFRTVHILAPMDLVEREDHMLKDYKAATKRP